MDEYDYYLASGLNPDAFGISPGDGSNNSGSNVTSGTSGSPSWLNSLFSSSGNVLTQALKNQSTAAQQKLAAKLGVAQASSSSNTLKIVIIAVVGLVAVGLAFAFLKRKKS
jgi:hypothetical protein